ncbi:FKBP-type peptidyl-prolyl cis-trans isomerase [Actinomadura algeriensis]|uniref:Peptidyl-prolyl cis-trans isomerase n=1 Tax=Actinomadura algeriensis TaxID=1679523 RepID=A0ABR9K068_9ACTN|nr:FKBP-type peptidyl-prolyl cis-trans isomerase [Actinomadura algeriensis]MBE1536227.1 peptidylprolyl isomerase [Actinomadura algeriensis]
MSAAVVLAVPLVFASSCSLFGGGVGVSVGGEFGKVPEVEFPDGGPDDSLAVETLEEGDGVEARKGDLVVADYVGYRWNDDERKLVASSYAEGEPGVFPTGTVVPGLAEALVGSRPGSRVVARIPPEKAFGEKGDTRHRVGPGDTLVYVLDVRGVYGKSAGPEGKAQPQKGAGVPKVGDAAAGQVPVVTMPKAAAPAKLRAVTLVQGEGPEVKGGQLVALQYAGYFWRNGRVFNSSWGAGHPAAMTIGTGEVLKGWDEGLVGRRVGSRVLLVVPPSLGYGEKGLSQYGIRGDDTLVFVVDLLGVH